MVPVGDGKLSWWAFLSLLKYKLMRGVTAKARRYTRYVEMHTSFIMCDAPQS
jgi:hypothetical protein